MPDTITTETQVSAGGVAYRRQGDLLEVVLISVGDQRRWQLPKGLVNQGESHEQAAVREVSEETGLSTELVEPLDKVEYWFYAYQSGQRVRIHKYVHFFLLHYLSGDVADHDQEVNEARWLDINQAQKLLTFDSDRRIVQLAHQRLQEQA